MTDLLLPASCLPGLLDGWVGPVVAVYGRDTHAMTWKMPSQDIGIDYTRISLDLTLPEVRDRCARVLARVVGLECGSTAPDWYWFDEEGEAGWTLQPIFECWHFCPSNFDRTFERTRFVPSLSTLDPSSNERLPDGSRKVDALALRLVCEHVGSTLH